MTEEDTAGADAGVSAAGRPAGLLSGRAGRGEARSAGRSTRRRARLNVRRVAPWSVFVLSFVVSLFLGLALLVAVAVLYSVLDGLGVLTSVDRFARELKVIDAGTSIVERDRVLLVTAVVAGIDVLLLTLLGTLMALLYNVCASFTGGFEVTLAEKD